MLDPQAYPEVDTNPVDPRSARPSPAALPYPGARWWSFDFHAHTPASADTPHWQQASGTDQEVTPERWLVQFMAAGIDCVAITDHNSGDWIDPLQAAYRQMEQEAGAIPIPAHADRSAPSGKALFAIREGSQASIVDATTLKQLFESAHLLAVEWENLERPFPACIREQAANLPKVLGSDSNSFQGARSPGSRLIWLTCAAAKPFRRTRFWRRFAL